VEEKGACVNVKRREGEKRKKKRKRKGERVVTCLAKNGGYVIRLSSLTHLQANTWQGKIAFYFKTPTLIYYIRTPTILKSYLLKTNI
jgi:hypothetical protein